MSGVDNDIFKASNEMEAYTPSLGLLTDSLTDLSA